MRNLVFAIALIGGFALANPNGITPPAEQYTASVQLIIDEPTPQLLRRSQKIAVKELENTFKSRRELELSNYDLKVSPSGQVLLTVSSNKDIQLPVQHALSSVITGIDGRVWARGRADVFRTNFTQPVEAALEIELADSYPEMTSAPDGALPGDQSANLSDIRIQRMVVANFPVKDVIQTLKGQISRDKGQTPFGHVMDRSCLRRYVDFSFNEFNDKKPKSLDTILEDLADSLNIKVKNKGGSYVFQGACPNYQEQQRTRPNMPTPFDTPGLNREAQLNNVAFRPIGAPGQHLNVHIPLMPLGRW